MDSAAFVAFLRMEADLSEEKAKRLRAQADALAEQHGITGEMEAAFELHPEEMAPLDENGIPKYKGRKRGRKPKKRKRQLNPNRQKRQHTAYTLFVQENYPSLRAHHPSLQSKDIIALVARQWAAVSEMERQVWKQRALETHEDEQHSEMGTQLHEHRAEHIVVDHGVDVDALEGVDGEEDEHISQEDEDKPDGAEATPKRRRGRQRKKS